MALGGKSHQLVNKLVKTSFDHSLKKLSLDILRISYSIANCVGLRIERSVDTFYLNIMIRNNFS